MGIRARERTVKQQSLVCAHTILHGRIGPKTTRRVDDYGRHRVESNKEHQQDSID